MSAAEPVVKPKCKAWRHKWGVAKIDQKSDWIYNECEKCGLWRWGVPVWMTYDGY